MKWKDIKVGDIMRDGSIVTQVHRTHEENSCKIIYDTDKEFICSYKHILLIDVQNLCEKGKEELEKFCTFVPLEENYEIENADDLSAKEKYIVERFCYNEPVEIQVDIISEGEIDVFDFHFEDRVKRIYVKNVITKSEPQKVDENTYWLNIYGIEYLMKMYDVELYCNGMIINEIIPMGDLPCFCISTNTGKYET
jgi:hypothetical protein